ncbi:MAG: DUF6273 domain-containing protein [Synergistaceae bacterium]|nr:DUF6273 domain-containing protein [Synergistaceae bacterium]
MGNFKSFKKVVLLVMLVVFTASFGTPVVTPAWAAGLIKIDQILNMGTGGGTGGGASKVTRSGTTITSVTTSDNAKTIYFGKYWQSTTSIWGAKEAIKWRVLSVNAPLDTSGTNNKGVLLLSDQGLYADAFNGSKVKANKNVWGKDATSTDTAISSEIRTTLNDRTMDGVKGKGFAADAFDQKEFDAIASTKHTAGGNQSGNDNVSTDKLFLLSGSDQNGVTVGEIYNTAYGFADDDSRISTATTFATKVAMYGNNSKVNVQSADSESAWLRSPGSNGDFAFSVNARGKVNGNGVTGDINAVRPAFNLNPESVLFLTAANATGKGASKIGMFSIDNTYTGSDGWKVTLKDTDITAPTVSSVTQTKEGDTVDSLAGKTNTLDLTNGLTVSYKDDLSVAYDAAASFTTGANYLSAVVKDSAGNYVNYAKIAEKSSSSPAKVGLGTLADGTYTMYVFAEKTNGDKETDYASDFSNAEGYTIGNGDVTIFADKLSATHKGKELTANLDKGFNLSFDADTYNTSVALANNATGKITAGGTGTEIKNVSVGSGASLAFKNKFTVSDLSVGNDGLLQITSDVNASTADTITVKNALTLGDSSMLKIQLSDPYFATAKKSIPVNNLALLTATNGLSIKAENITGVATVGTYGIFTPIFSVVDNNINLTGFNFKGDEPGGKGHIYKLAYLGKYKSGDPVPYGHVVKYDKDARTDILYKVKNDDGKLWGRAGRDSTISTREELKYDWDDESKTLKQHTEVGDGDITVIYDNKTKVSGARTSEGVNPNVTAYVKSYVPEPTAPGDDGPLEGGAIYTNNCNNTDIKADFVANYLNANAKSIRWGTGGGAIYNSSKNSKIGDITGDFIGNFVLNQNPTNADARGGAIYNLQSASIGNIYGDFIGNFVKGAQWVYGGAIQNSYRTTGFDVDKVSTIGNIVGDFVGNYAEATYGAAAGGAINNECYFDEPMSGAKIGDITGNFIGNYVKTNANTHEEFSLVGGGAISNVGSVMAEEKTSIGNITGDFIGNYVVFSTDRLEGVIVAGGAIRNTNATIGDISGNFIGNYVQVQDGKERTKAYGGAIYNEHGKIKFLTKDTDIKFADNTAKVGGAIYNDGNGTVKLYAASGKSITFEGKADDALVDSVHNEGRLYINGDGTDAPTTGTVNFATITNDYDIGMMLINGGTVNIKGDVAQKSLTVAENASLNFTGNTELGIGSIVNRGSVNIAKGGAVKGKFNFDARSTNTEITNNGIWYAVNSLSGANVTLSDGGTIDVAYSAITKDAQGKFAPTYNKKTSYDTATVSNLVINDGELKIQSNLGAETPTADRLIATALTLGENVKLKIQVMYDPLFATAKGEITGKSAVVLSTESEGIVKDLLSKITTETVIGTHGKFTPIFGINAEIPNSILLTGFSFTGDGPMPPESSQTVTELSKEEDKAWKSINVTGDKIKAETPAAVWLVDKVDSETGKGEFKLDSAGATISATSTDKKSGGPWLYGIYMKESTAGHTITLSGGPATISAINNKADDGAGATGFHAEGLTVKTGGKDLTIDTVTSKGSGGDPAAASYGVNLTGATLDLTNGSTYGTLTIGGADAGKGIISTASVAYGLDVEGGATVNSGKIIIKNVSTPTSAMAFGAYLEGEDTSVKTNGNDITIIGIQSSGKYGSARGIAQYNGAELNLEGKDNVGKLTIDGVKSIGAEGNAFGYNVTAMTVAHKGSVTIRNIEAKEAFAIFVDGWQGDLASELTLGYDGEKLSGGTYQIEGDVAAAKDNGSATAKLTMALQNKDSYLYGNLLSTYVPWELVVKGNITVDLLDGGKWYPAFNASHESKDNNATVTLSKGTGKDASEGVIDLAYSGFKPKAVTPGDLDPYERDKAGALIPEYNEKTDFATATISNLVIKNGLLKIQSALAKSDAAEDSKTDSITVTELIFTGELKIQVMYDPFFAKATGKGKFDGKQIAVLTATKFSTGTVTGVTTEYDGKKFTPTFAFDDTKGIIYIAGFEFDAGGPVPPDPQKSTKTVTELSKEGDKPWKEITVTGADITNETPAAVWLEDKVDPKAGIGEFKLDEKGATISATSTADSKNLWLFGIYMKEKTKGHTITLSGGPATISVVNTLNEKGAGATGLNAEWLTVKTGGKDLTVETVQAKADCAYGIVLDGATLDLTNGTTYGKLTIGSNDTGKGISSASEKYVTGLNLISDATINSGAIDIKNVSSESSGTVCGLSLSDNASAKTNDKDVTITEIKSSGMAAGLSLVKGSELDLGSGKLTIDGVKSTGSGGFNLAVGYLVDQATVAHKGSVSIRNVEGPGAFAIATITSVDGNPAKLTLGYNDEKGTTLSGGTYQIEGDVVAAKVLETATSELKMALQNDASYLYGNFLTKFDLMGLKEQGNITLDLLDGGKWYPVSVADPKFENDATVTLSKGTGKDASEGVIDLAYSGFKPKAIVKPGDLDPYERDENGALIPVYDNDKTAFRTVQVSNLVIKNGLLKIQSNVKTSGSKADALVASALTIGDGAELKIQVMYDPAFKDATDDITGEHIAVLTATKVVAGTLSKDMVTGVATMYGDKKFTPTFDFDATHIYLTGFTYGGEPPVPTGVKTTSEALGSKGAETDTTFFEMTADEKLTEAWGTFIARSGGKTTLTLKGAGTSKNTVDGNGNNGLTVDGKDHAVTVEAITVTNMVNPFTVTKGSLTLDGVTIGTGVSGDITNDDILTLKGVTTLTTSLNLTGSGETTLEGTLAGSGALTIKGGKLALDASQYLADRLVLDEGGTLKFTGGTLSGDINNNGTVTAESGVVVNSTITNAKTTSKTEIKKGASFGANGKIDGGVASIGEDVKFSSNNVANLTELSATNSIYNFSATLGTGTAASPFIKADDILTVGGKATGTIKLGTIKLSGTSSDEWAADTSQVMQYLNAEDGSSLEIVGSKMQTSTGYKYTFSQAMKDNKAWVGYMTVLKQGGAISYTLKEIVNANPTEAGEIDSYIVEGLYDVTKDLGALNNQKRNGEFTIFGNTEGDAPVLYGNGNKGITVADTEQGGKAGDILNIQDLTMKDFDVALTNKADGVVNLSNVDFTSTSENADIINDGTLNLNGEVSFGAGVDGKGTMNVASDQTFADGVTIVQAKVNNEADLENNALIRVTDVVNKKKLTTSMENLFAKTISNSGTFDITGGTLSQTVANKDGITKLEKGASFGTSGKVDNGKAELKEDVNFSAKNVTNLTGLDTDNATYDFSATLGEGTAASPFIKADDILTVGGKATGTIKFGSISLKGVASEDWAKDTSKEMQYMTAAAGSNLIISNSKCYQVVSGSGIIDYTFSQAMNGEDARIGYMNVEKKSSAKQIQDLVSDPESSGFSVEEGSDIDVEGGTLGVLDTSGKEDPTYTISGKNAEDTSLVGDGDSEKTGITVANDGDTLIVKDITMDNFGVDIENQEGGTVKLEDIAFTRTQGEADIVNEGTVNLNGTATFDKGIKDDDFKGTVVVGAGATVAGQGTNATSINTGKLEGQGDLTVKGVTINLGETIDGKVAGNFTLEGAVLAGAGKENTAETTSSLTVAKNTSSGFKNLSFTVVDTANINGKLTLDAAELNGGDINVNASGRLEAMNGSTISGNLTTFGTFSVYGNTTIAGSFTPKGALIFHLDGHKADDIFLTTQTPVNLKNAAVGLIQNDPYYKLSQGEKMTLVTNIVKDSYRGPSAMSARSSGGVATYTYSVGEAALPSKSVAARVNSAQSVKAENNHDAKYAVEVANGLPNAQGMSEAKIVDATVTTNDQGGVVLGEENANDVYALVLGYLGHEATKETKSFSQAKLAVTAAVNSGSDLIATSVMENATPSGKKWETFAALGGSRNRYDEIGSNVDLNMFNVAAGLSGKVFDNLTLGVFVEGGDGRYNTEDRFAAESVLAKGDVNYFGGGLFAKYEGKKTDLGQFHGEASMRAGHINSKYNSANFNPGTFTSFDLSGSYLGAHAGFGYKWNVSGKRTIDTYVKYLWSRQGNSSNVMDGETIDLEAINSHRLRAGFRLNGQSNDKGFNLFGGLAYEYEFDGKAKGSVGTSAMPMSDFKGGSGLAEFGVKFDRLNSAWKGELSLQGYTGRRDSIGANLSIWYMFGK